jgi:hypothetical protein
MGLTTSLPISVYPTKLPGPVLDWFTLVSRSILDPPKGRPQSPYPRSDLADIIGHLPAAIRDHLPDSYLRALDAPPVSVADR